MEYTRRQKRLLKKLVESGFDIKSLQSLGEPNKITRIEDPYKSEVTPPNQGEVILGNPSGGLWYDMSAFRQQELPQAPINPNKEYEIDVNQKDTRKVVTPSIEDLYGKQPKKTNTTEKGLYIPPAAGLDLESRLFAMGKGIGSLTAKDDSGRRLVTGSQRAGAWGEALGGAGSFLLGSARQMGSGMGYGRVNAFLEDEYRRKQREQFYTPASQYGDANMSDGISVSKYGGIFEEGGEQEEMMEQPQETSEEDGQLNPQLQQIMISVAKALEEGESPQLIIQSLMQKGLSQEQATQIVTQVIQRIQQMESQNSEEQEQGSEELMMRKGGRFNYKVGDHIKFKSGGVMREGKIRKIENGKIFL